MGHKANIDPPWRKNARASIVITPRCHKCCQCYAVCGAAAAAQQQRGNVARLGNELDQASSGRPEPKRQLETTAACRSVPSILPP